MPRFVILRHETPAGYLRPSHFDLMLEQGPVLRTWACEAVPTPERPVAAERLADHRPDYLDFEGAVAGSRGSVTRIASGEYELLAETDSLVRVRLASPQLTGELTLEQDAAAPQRWRVSLVPDASSSA